MPLDLSAIVSPVSPYYEHIKAFDTRDASKGGGGVVLCPAVNSNLVEWRDQWQAFSGFCSLQVSYLSLSQTSNGTWRLLELSPSS